MSGFTVTPGLENLLPTYRAELVKDCAILQTLRTASLADLAVNAHGMGGKCAMMGDGVLAAMLYDLEQVALAGDVPHCADLVDQILALSAHRSP